jgi:anti-sigma factor RsiW
MTEDEEDLMLMRLADGELPEPEAAVLRARLAGEPALAARYALFTGTRRLTADAFAPVAEEKVPDRLLAAVRAAAAPPAASAAAPPTATILPFRRRAARFVPLALAASVAALLAAPVGYLMGRPGGAGLGDPLAASGALVVAALEQDASGGERRDAGRVVRVLATHPVEGGVCRDVLVEAPEGAALGIACRDGGAWRLRASVALVGGEALRPANADHPVIAAALERLGAAPPLDAEREAAMIGRGWR